MEMSDETVYKEAKKLYRYETDLGDFDQLSSKEKQQWMDKAVKRKIEYEQKDERQP
jgi:hypothetical protein